MKCAASVNPQAEQQGNNHRFQAWRIGLRGVGRERDQRPEIQEHEGLTKTGTRYLDFIQFTKYLNKMGSYTILKSNI